MEKSVDTAIKWCERGDQAGSAFCGRLWAELNTGRVNAREVEAAFKRAADRGDEVAMFRYAQSVARMSAQAALPYANKSVALGYTPAQPLASQLNQIMVKSAAAADEAARNRFMDNLSKVIDSIPANDTSAADQEREENNMIYMSQRQGGYRCGSATRRKLHGVGTLGGFGIRALEDAEGQKRSAVSGVFGVD